MLIIVRALLSLTIAVVFQYFLLERRFERKNTLIILITGVSIIALLNAVFLVSKDTALYARLYPLTINVPFCLLFLFLSKRRNFRSLFNILTGIYLCNISTITSHLIAMAFNLSVVASIAGLLVTFVPLLLLIIKVFRPLYMQMLDKLKTGWALFCTIPLLLHVLNFTLYVYPVTIYKRPENMIPIYLALAIVFAAYAVICIFFRQTQQQFAMQNEQQLLRSQVEALQYQIDVVSEADKKVQILRHDIRHYMQNIAILVQSGDVKTAMDFIGNIDDLFEQTTIPKYCENTTVNAILTYYLESAKKEGICIETRLDIPEKIPADDIELCAVLANAIENARHACRKLPDGARKSIELVCVSKPHFVLEVSNTFRGEVLFGPDNLPVSIDVGHGIGTQSIAAFVKKHNAMLDYQTENDKFQLRILLP